MQKLQTVNAETLLYEPLEKPSFVVDSLIPTGLSLFCGSQKIGKSWLMLKLCLCVSQGIPLWDMPTMEGDVLYLCLEDTFCRIQDTLRQYHCLYEMIHHRSKSSDTAHAIAVAEHSDAVTANRRVCCSIVQTGCRSSY